MFALLYSSLAFGLWLARQCIEESDVMSLGCGNV
jgi:hypothetical protein